jgi:hypothetical protein
VCGKVAKECGDRWEGRYHFKTKPTVGYSGITPVSRLARWLAAMEAMTGLLYVAVLIARLVSLY